jgi:hypothetical protein
MCEVRDRLFMRRGHISSGSASGLSGEGANAEEQKERRRRGGAVAGTRRLRGALPRSRGAHSTRYAIL